MQLSKISGGLPVRLSTRTPSRHPHHWHESNHLHSTRRHLPGRSLSLSWLPAMTSPPIKAPSVGFRPPLKMIFLEKSPLITLRLPRYAKVTIPTRLEQAFPGSGQLYSWVLLVRKTGKTPRLPASVSDPPRNGSLSLQQKCGPRRCSADPHLRSQEGC